MSMAKSLLGSAVSKAATAAAAEMSLLMGVKKDIWYVSAATVRIPAVVFRSNPIHLVT